MAITFGHLPSHLSLPNSVKWIHTSGAFAGLIWNNLGSEYLRPVDGFPNSTIEKQCCIVLKALTQGPCSLDFYLGSVTV